jgi:hypothetical protein
MIKFEKPINLNGNELIAELETAGISVNSIPELDENGFLLLDIDPKNETKAKAIVSKHNGTDGVKPMTVEQKLESLGLTLEELKSLLA